MWCPHVGWSSDLIALSTQRPTPVDFLVGTAVRRDVRRGFSAKIAACAAVGNVQYRTEHRELAVRGLACSGFGQCESGRCRGGHSVDCGGGAGGCHPPPPPPPRPPAPH